MDEKKRILLIDDDEMVRDIIQVALIHEGMEVDACGNGAEGLYTYLRNHDQYSAVILDLLMPEVGGDVFLQVVESLVKSKTLHAFPFVIVNTAVDDFTHLKKLSEYGCVYEVCSKPVSPEKLIRFIDQIQRSLPIR